MNQRNTKQKRIVYEALCALGHPSATELYERVHETHPTLSRGTVFRVLSAFAEEGRAVKLSFRDSDVRYDATLSKHFHARCRRCGAVRDVFSPALLATLGEVETEGFLADGCAVEFSGLCAECAENENS